MHSGRVNCPHVIIPAYRSWITSQTMFNGCLMTAAVKQQYAIFHVMISARIKTGVLDKDI